VLIGDWPAHRILMPKIVSQVPDQDWMCHTHPISQNKHHIEVQVRHNTRETAKLEKMIDP